MYIHDIKRGHRDYSNHRTDGFYELPGSHSKDENTMSHVFSLSDSSALINESDLPISTLIGTSSPHVIRMSYFSLAIDCGLDGFKKPVLRIQTYTAMNERRPVHYDPLHCQTLRRLTA